MPSRFATTTTTLVTTLATTLGLTCISSVAAAQWMQHLDSPDAAKSYCGLSDAAPETKSEEEARRYEAQRRRLIHRTIRVQVGPEQAPIVDYDRLTGLLTVSTYGPIPLFSDFALVLGGQRPLEFEVSEERAEALIARYRTGHARLRISFLPAAYSRYDSPLCVQSETTKPTRTAIVGELLSAEFVDEVGQELATFKTELGHEVAMMRSHDIQGYLHAALPSVAVASIVAFDRARRKSDADPVPEAVRETLKAEFQKTLYGCYLRGLTRNARLQGALVLKLEADGKTSPQILVDSLQHSDVTACVTERIGRIFEQRKDLPEIPTLKATVYFKLEDPGSL